MTINKINRKIYVGVHSTENENEFDGYLGCGVMINSPSSYKNSKTPFQYAVNKYGVNNFIRITIKSFDKKQDAFNLEKEIVTNHFISRKDTYNATIGGGSAPKQDKIIYQYTLEGSYIKTWNSIKEASIEYGCTATSIANAISFNGSSCGYYWTDFLVEKLNVSNYTLRQLERKVFKYDNNGVFVSEYNSIISAANDIKVLQSAIGRAIKGGYKVKGFNFSFEKLEEFKLDKNKDIKNKVIHMYNTDGNYVMSFNNSIEASRFLNLKSTSKISSAIRLDRPIGEYKFSLEKTERIKLAEKGITKPKRVGQYDLNGVLICEYPTITCACNTIGRGVVRSLKNQKESYKGFVFKYL